MWIFSRFGLFSAVCARDLKSPFSKDVDKSLIMVRARAKAHLARLIEAFPAHLGGLEIVAKAGTDYPYRLFVPRPAWTAVVVGLTDDVDYGNFKSAAGAAWPGDPDRYVDALHSIWGVGLRVGAPKRYAPPLLSRGTAPRLFDAPVDYPSAASFGRDDPDEIDAALDELRALEHAAPEAPAPCDPADVPAAGSRWMHGGRTFTVDRTDGREAFVTFDPDGGAPTGRFSLSEWPDWHIPARRRRGRPRRVEDAPRRDPVKGKAALDRIRETQGRHAAAVAKYRGDIVPADVVDAVADGPLLDAVTTGPAGDAPGPVPAPSDEVFVVRAREGERVADVVGVVLWASEFPNGLEAYAEAVRHGAIPGVPDPAVGREKYATAKAYKVPVYNWRA